MCGLEFGRQEGAWVRTNDLRGYEMEKESAFREEEAEQIGIDFDLPKPLVVPCVPRDAVQTEVDTAVELVVK